MIATTIITSINDESALAVFPPEHCHPSYFVLVHP
mgnify:CR=1 FL=1